MSGSPAQPVGGLSTSPTELLQTLIRFDTSNPPGNERESVHYINQLLTQAGLQTELVVRSPHRPNMIARLPGSGDAPPLLLYGHIDVVPATGQDWQHPPFEAQISQDYVWGRGALDMKGGIVMMLAAILRAKEEGTELPGDVVLAVLSDEEAGGEYGARYLVENHAHRFKGIRYALGEFGGFSFPISGKRFYPIMVAEKQICHLRVRVRGTSGHGSLATKDGVMRELARILDRLERRSLPVHVTLVPRQMFQAVASQVPRPTGFALRRLLNPALTNITLKLMGDKATAFSPLFRHTVNATVVQGGQSVNMAPGEVELLLDGRLLPGFGPEDLLTELEGIIGNETAIEVIHHDPGPPQPDMAMFDTLAEVLREADPQGEPVPMLLPGSTDARFFSRLGIQTYGFLPMQLPEGFRFLSAVHGVDERIPLEALTFGADAIFKVLLRFGRV